MAEYLHLFLPALFEHSYPVHSSQPELLPAYAVKLKNDTTILHYMHASQFNYRRKVFLQIKPGIFNQL
jgi:hypothetical protein